MRIKDLVIPPTTVTILTTYQCTAACRNCCSQCNPNIKERLTFEKMKGYLDMCLKAYPDSIKVFVLTGGECFLLGNDLVKIIEYANSKGLIVRVVTNGYWAQTYEKAYKKLKKLTDIGLREINFSTGDDHQEWVKYDNVINGSIAAADLGLTCVVNVETHDNASFNNSVFLKDERILHYLQKDSSEKKRIRIINGVWVPFLKETNVSYNKTIIGIPKERCTGLLNAININPYSSVLACCGLFNERILPLRLGNLSLKGSDLKQIYEDQFSDFIKIWLFVDGPYKILEWVYKKRNIKKEIPNGHICMQCAILFKEQQNIETIQVYLDEILSSVLLKYQLFLKH